jgi:Protein of unknown function (DUF1749)
VTSLASTPLPLSERPHLARSESPLVLWSGADEYVPPDINGSNLIKVWDAALPAGSRRQYNGINREALHAVPDEPGRSNLVGRVSGFLTQSVLG